MKKSLLILLFFVSLFTSKAQDKIITIQKDTIDCRIISIGSGHINYEQKVSTNQHIGKSIAVSDVLQYYRTEQSYGKNAFFLQNISRQKPEHRYLFRMQAGPVHLFNDFVDFKNRVIGSGAPTSEADDYIGKLKNGYNLNASFHYLLTTSLGIGVDYSFSKSASEGNFLVNEYGRMNIPTYANMEVNEKIFIHFLGPSVMFQQFPDKKRKIKITEILSPGIVSFRDESRGNQYQIYWGENDFYMGHPPQYFDLSNSVTKSTTLGVKGGLSLEYCFTSQLSAGLAGSFIWGKLHKASIKSLNYNMEDQELENDIDISHINYGFTVRYNF